MHGSFNLSSVESFYKGFGMDTPSLKGESSFDFSRTAKNKEKAPRVAPGKKVTKAEQKVEEMRQVLEMAEQLYSKKPSEAAKERVSRAQDLYSITQELYSEDLKQLEREFQYSENYDLYDFTRCVKSNNTSQKRGRENRGN